MDSIAESDTDEPRTIDVEDTVVARAGLALFTVTEMLTECVTTGEPPEPVSVTE